ncbi:MAG: hypothetical protein LH617_10755 [Ramlibacter sp.]|nr:hypothetical protein [Ramlibacter sp.]
MNIPLRAGLVLFTGVTRPAGNIQTTLRVTAVTPTSLKLVFTGKQADGSPLTTTRTVRLQDIADARGIRPNFVDGATEFFPGNTAFGTSTQVLGELKRSGSTELTIDVGGLSMGTGVAGAGLGRELDGMLGEMGGFAAISEALEGAAARGAISESERADAAGTMAEIDQLQMAAGTLRSGGKTTLTVLVNGQERELPGVIAKGRIQTDKEAHDVELVFLDDPANPLTLRSRIGSERTVLLRINYPVAK